jgi:hypothetical protein
MSSDPPPFVDEGLFNNNSGNKTDKGSRDIDAFGCPAARTANCDYEQRASKEGIFNEGLRFGDQIFGKH